MPEIRFASAFQRHLPCPPRTVQGRSVRAALEAYFAAQPLARGYVLDEGGGLRRHVMVFVDGEAIRERGTLADPVDEGARIEVIQALSGG